MPITFTAVSAFLGGLAAEGELPPGILDAVTESLGASFEGTRVFAAGGNVVAVARHDAGEDNTEVHRAFWLALQAGANVARARGLHQPGRDLVADDLPAGGLLPGAGPSVAELTFEARAAEAVVLLAGVGAGVGSLNGALYRAFADPLNTAGLVRSPAMHSGFVFEVHDLRERRKAMFQTPSESHALLAHLAASGRYVIKRVVSGDTGTLAAAASTEAAAHAIGTPTGSDDPIAIIRTHGEFPTSGELTEPFTLPLLGSGVGAAGHLGALLPASASSVVSRDIAAAPVYALGLQLGATIEGPRDLFADEAFDAPRERARALGETLRRQGPIEPHYPPFEEGEALPPVLATALAERWTSLGPPAPPTDDA